MYTYTHMQAKIYMYTYVNKGNNFKNALENIYVIFHKHIYYFSDVDNPSFNTHFSLTILS